MSPARLPPRARLPRLAEVLAVASELGADGARAAAAHARVSFMGLGFYCSAADCPACRRRPLPLSGWRFGEPRTLWEALDSAGLVPASEGPVRGWACPCGLTFGCNACRGGLVGGVLDVPPTVHAAVAWASLGDVAETAEALAGEFGVSLPGDFPLRRVVWRNVVAHGSPRKILRFASRPGRSYWSDGRVFRGHVPDRCASAASMWNAGTPLAQVVWPRYPGAEGAVVLEYADG